ncbi:hypothetical protein MHEC_17000 [Mycobacterium heckeshornense]|uniref:Uncharacterized protein n=1 Tax=Mycobacterium heckeshornense TaxID=110505 RepID=A0A7R7JFC4_9MYCO|nr:hypothetical protein MHEC_17000 [Mycobacterium heckeshornense]
MTARMWPIGHILTELVFRVAQGCATTLLLRCRSRFFAAAFLLEQWQRLARDSRPLHRRQMTAQMWQICHIYRYRFVIYAALLSFPAVPFGDCSRFFAAALICSASRPATTTANVVVGASNHGLKHRGCWRRPRPAVRRWRPGRSVQDQVPDWYTYQQTSRPLSIQGLCRSPKLSMPATWDNANLRTLSFPQRAIGRR